ncbi:MAG TPA: flagellar biosynthesis protein FlhA [Sedimentisphaerales bacterium]|nr:flagellar biosynthesis protein FlhA [Sedimentisphaerales bacterium]
MPASDNIVNHLKLSSSIIKHSNLILAIAVVMVLATLLIPLPTWILDLLLACSISSSIAILIITLASKEAMELSTFPSLLLFTTIFRLSLNVASTRLILLQGSAGKIIQTFGEFVAGGSVIVGIIIFLILVVIQFIVITKGASRIGEVSARFTLDAMPGKQMAIDADLNAGAITETQANERRTKIVKESEFYGAMDGAMKFVSGDAKAGMIITIINLIGGIMMGYKNGMDISNALKTYSILSIGDGLVSQIPSIIISLSSGFLVTKISSKQSLGQDLSIQLFMKGQPLIVASVIIGVMSLVPGLPALPFLILSAACATIGINIKASDKPVNEKKKNDTNPQKTEQPVEELLDIDKVSVSVGVRLIGMVDPRKGSSIFDRIGALRRRFAQQLGIIIPLVRLKDDITLEPTAYQIRISDHTVAKGKLETDMFLAMDSGSIRTPVDGIKTTEPVYGLPALWVTKANKEKAELNGYTIIDPESVFITHLSETLRKHAHELLTREDVQMLVDRLRKTQPSLVGEVIGELVSIGLLQRVLKNLLADSIPVKELTAILEALGENASKTKNAETLTEMVRKSLSRTITEQYKDQNGKLKAITLEPALEHQMTSSLQQQPNGVMNLSLPADTAMQIGRNIAMAWKKIMENGVEKVVLLCDSRLRSALASMLARTVPPLAVIAYDEIILSAEIEPLETINIRQAGLTAHNTPQLAGI